MCGDRVTDNLQGYETICRLLCYVPSMMLSHAIVYTVETCHTYRYRIARHALRHRGSRVLKDSVNGVKLERIVSVLTTLPFPNHTLK